MSINYWTKGGVLLGARHHLEESILRMSCPSINGTFGGVYLSAPLRRLFICVGACLTINVH